MEIDMVQPEDSGDDLCSYVLSQFGNSKNEHHLHVCTSMGTMSQELKDHNLPRTPLMYFGAICSSLDRLLSESEPPGHILDAMLAILSPVAVRIPPVILQKRYTYLSKILVRVLHTQSVGVESVATGLKIASWMLSVMENVVWEDVSQLYCFIVGYMTDSRDKVRNNAHECLRDVLEKFQRIPVLACPASEVITNVFERYFLLDGGSSSDTSEGPRAQEVLYILDALRICLPFMAQKSLITILKYFKSLLEFRNQLVTKRVTDSLYALCLNSKGDVPPGALLDLLCSLSNSISTETSADSMTLTARLLDAGMKWVFSSNRELCVVKLPVIFNALKEMLGSGHEEASVAAVAAFKSLIQSCIDERLIKQGVDNTRQKTDSVTGKNSPSVMEKVCATIDSLLDYHYEDVWDMSFQIISALFDKLGKDSFYLMEGTLNNLADMEKLPDGDFGFRKQLYECLGMALAAIGPEDFLRILPLNLDVQDLSESNLWLFPILKQYTVCARLSYFTRTILPMAVKMKNLSEKVKQEGKLHLSRSVDGIIYSLWSLLPSFCNYPLDTAESFKYLEPSICAVLKEQPHLCGIVCSSLQILIQQNKKFVDKNQSVDVEVGPLEKRGLAIYDEQIAHSNLCTVKSFSDDLFHALSEAYLKSSKDIGGILLATLGEVASISQKGVVSNFFMKTMQRLLVVTRKAVESTTSKNSDLMLVDDATNAVTPSTERAQLFDLAASLLPGLESKEVDVMFMPIKPALKDADGLIQKRAYKVLSLIFQNGNDFISRRLDELLHLMEEAHASCQASASAKRYRLDCLYFLIIYVLKERSEKSRLTIATSFLSEIILALKEVNKKARNRAYDILVQIGRSLQEEEEDCKKEKLHQLFNLVAVGLTGETPQMISAAVTGLARLAYEFSDLVSTAYSILPSAFLLLRRKNKEINKANLGLIKVLVAKSQVQSLQTHLRGLVEGLLNWQDSTKSHFKAKVKLLLEMLVRKCGLKAVKEVMPEEHMKLLTNIRKLQERKERIHSGKSIDGGSIHSKANTARLSGWNHTKIFSEFDGTDTVHGGKSTLGRKSKGFSMVQSKALRSKRTRAAVKGLQEESFEQFEEDPLDLLDIQKTRSALRSTQPLKRKNDSDDEFEIDPEGRMIIVDGGKRKKVSHKQKEEASDSETEGKSDGRSHLSTTSKRSQKRRKTSETGGWAYTGKEYASKKAGGDVTRKGKLEPYAYWPLDRKMLSRRPEHRAAARKGMASIVKLTKKFEGRSASNALSDAELRRKKRKAKKT